MKKRILGAVSVGLLACMIFIAAIAYGNTSSTSESGKIQIDQKITQTSGPLVPSVYKDGDDWVGLNELNNLSVSVENGSTSTDSAYIRTIFAFEAGDLTLEKFHDLMCINVDSSNWIWPANSSWTEIEVDGERYFMVTATYNSSVEVGDMTTAGLKGIGMDWYADGNDLEAAGFGDEYKILTYSQAVQTTGFTGALEAFSDTYGTVNAENNPWNVIYVSTFEELIEALKTDKKVVLIDDITVDQGSITLE